MPTTKDDIRRWLAEGQKKGATHVIVMVDTFDHEDYPVYVMPGKTAEETRKEHMAKQSMCRVMECYSLSMDLEAQLNEHRAQNWN